MTPDPTIFHLYFGKRNVKNKHDENVMKSIDIYQNVTQNSTCARQNTLHIIILELLVLAEQVYKGHFKWRAFKPG